MCTDEIENRKSKRKYLETWLRNLESAQNSIPNVQRELDLTNWEIEVLSNLPDEASEVPHSDFWGNFEKDFDYTKSTFPSLPYIDPSPVSSSASISTAGTTCVYQYVARIGDIDTPNAFEFSELFTGRYQQIQKTYDLPQEIRILLAKLPNKNTLERFVRAEKSFSSFKAGVGEKTSSAMEMRTFLDGLSGTLFQLARDWDKENMTWGKMVKRLSKGTESSEEYQVLLDQETRKSSLICRLSEIGKDREGGSITDLNHIWTELLDHLFTILNLIRF